MPRPRVRDEDRKRVARACDTCKRRKEKCDGQHPCGLCQKRGREPECTFTEGFSARRSTGGKRESVVSPGDNWTPGSGTHGRSRSEGDEYLDEGLQGQSQGHRRKERRVTLNDALNANDERANGNSDEGMAIESLLTLSGGRSGQQSTHDRTPVVELENPDLMFARNEGGMGTVGVGYGRGLSSGAFGDGGMGLGEASAVQNTNARDSVSASTTGAVGVESRAPVPKLARLLKDGHGKFIFVGDSSNLAFVQNIRRLVKSEIGESRLTSDPLRHAMVEVIPPHPVGSAKAKVQKPSLSEARDLVRHFLLASSGVIDLFDGEDVMEEICEWVQEKEKEGEDLNGSIYYLVLAIGAQVRNGTERKTQQESSQAERYLWRGRELVAGSFMDDPSVLTIQSYALITFYMLSACRRNGAFMLLGIAVRAAYALGLHRSDISSLFEPRERKTRERVWKSLRVLDLYMSASLGRPPATSEVDGGSVSWDRATRDYETIQMGGLNSSAMLRICFIFERIMNEVYCRREVSVQLVESISRQYRDWTLQLPAGLQTDGLDQKPGETSPTLQQTIGVAHLKGAYYWSIILLTRPFLIFKVSSKIKGKSEDGEHAPTVTSTLSEACIDAALRNIEIATDLIHTPGVPKRLFMVTNSTFVSAMVIGFAIFGDFDKHFPLLSSIEQAIAILAIMAKDDPSGRRYEQITTYLKEAAQEHIRRREQKEAQRRRQDINNIFGDPIKEPVTETPRPLDQGILIPTDLGDMDGTGVNDTMQQEPWSLKFEMPAEGRGPVLTTSGTLAVSNGDESGQAPFDLSRYGFDQNAYDPFSPNGSGVPSLPSYAEEFPLFSLMTEFDQLADPYQLGVA